MNGLNLVSQLKKGQDLNYKKLIFIALADGKTVAKLEFEKKQLVKDDLLKNTKMLFQNVHSETDIQFRVLVESEKQEHLQQEERD